MYRPWAHNPSNTPRLPQPSTAKEDAQPNESTNKRQERPPTVQNSNVPPRRVSGHPSQRGRGRGRGGYKAAAPDPVSLVTHYHQQRGRGGLPQRPAGNRNVAGTSNPHMGISSSHPTTSAIRASHSLPSRPSGMAQTSTPHQPQAQPQSQFNVWGRDGSFSGENNAPVTSGSRNVHSSNSYAGIFFSEPKPLASSLTSLERPRSPPSKRRKLIDGRDIRSPSPARTPAPVLPSAPPSSMSPRSSTGVTLVEEPKVKKERSPSSEFTPVRRLVTSGSRLFAPLPLQCLKSNPGYARARTQWAEEEAKRLRALGLRVIRTFVREDGLVIDWRSSKPVMSDTMEPDPEDSGAVIERALTRNYTALEAVRSAKGKSLPSTQSRPVATRPASTTAATASRMEQESGRSSSAEVMEIISSPTEESKLMLTEPISAMERNRHSESRLETSRTALPRPMAGPSYSQSPTAVLPLTQHPTPHQRVPLFLPSPPRPSLNIPHNPTIPVKRKADLISTEPEYDSTDVFMPTLPLASFLTPVPAPPPAPAMSPSEPSPPPAPRTPTPRDTSIASSGRQPAHHAMPGSASQSTTDLYHRLHVDAWQTPPRSTDNPVPEPEVITVPDDAEDDDLYEGSLGYPEDDPIAHITYDQPCTDLTISEDWPLNEEISKLYDVGLDFLRSYIVAFNDEREELACAYARNATFSYQTVCSNESEVPCVAAFAPAAGACGFPPSSTLTQGRLGVVSALLDLGDAQFSVGENVNYLLAYIGPTIGTLLTVDGTLREPEGQGRLDFAMSFVLREKEHDEEDRWTDAVWPLVAVSHQMTIRVHNMTMTP